MYKSRHRPYSMSTERASYCSSLLQWAYDCDCLLAFLEMRLFPSHPTFLAKGYCFDPSPLRKKSAFTEHSTFLKYVQQLCLIPTPKNDAVRGTRVR